RVLVPVVGHVRTRTTAVGVGARHAGQPVVAVTAVEEVAAGVADQPVVARVAEDAVVPVVAGQVVVAGAAAGGGGPGSPRHGVVAVTTVEGRARRRAGGHRADGQGVVTGVAVERGGHDLVHEELVVARTPAHLRRDRSLDRQLVVAAGPVEDHRGDAGAP